MKESIEDIYADIELQYGKKNMDTNIAYILSLLEERMKDGVLDDNIPIPSHEAAAKTILLLLDRPELPWETICREKRVKNVMEYLFIRAHSHYDEVHDFVSSLLRNYVKGISPQMILTFINMWRYAVCQNKPTRFSDEILYPEYADRILDTLRFLLQDEVGKGAALVMTCARDEGLVRNIAHAVVSTEFKHISKTATTIMSIIALRTRKRTMSSAHCVQRLATPRTLTEGLHSKTNSYPEKVSSSRHGESSNHSVHNIF